MDSENAKDSRELDAVHLLKPSWLSSDAKNNSQDRGGTSDHQLTTGL